jgi:aerobic-type carbon monoxide dehydrogenase small subunit (CoxS/CutS family)
MKFKMTVNGHNILVDAQQLETIVDTLSFAEHLTEIHVGNNQGTQGYQNAYMPAIKPIVGHELFQVAPVSQDFIDTIKLAARLEDETKKLVLNRNL